MYDQKSSSLLLFGGWSNRWLGDLVKLNVSSIIGPPYACTSRLQLDGPERSDAIMAVARHLAECRSM